MSSEILFKTKLMAALLFLILATVMGKLLAQPISIRNLTDNKYAFENLLDGIKSENEGVKRSSVYFAGKYRIIEAEELLIEQLEREQVPKNRILIALALFEIGTRDGLSAVKNLAVSDKNEKVRRISALIYAEYLDRDFSKKL